MLRARLSDVSRDWTAWTDHLREGSERRRDPRRRGNTSFRWSSSAGVARCSAAPHRADRPRGVIGARRRNATTGRSWKSPAGIAAERFFRFTPNCFRSAVDRAALRALRDAIGLGISPEETKTWRSRPCIAEHCTLGGTNVAFCPAELALCAASGAICSSPLQVTVKGIKSQ